MKNIESEAPKSYLATIDSHTAIFLLLLLLLLLFGGGGGGVVFSLFGGGLANDGRDFFQRGGPNNRILTCLQQVLLMEAYNNETG